MSVLCLCCSGKPYKSCCKPLHDGTPPPNALALMRSRYTAYARCLVDYIIKTTHPDNPNVQPNLEEWKRQVLNFCHSTKFQKLEILEFIDALPESYVTFAAYLKQDDKDFIMKEKSLFTKDQGQWLYRSGLYIE